MGVTRGVISGAGFFLQESQSDDIAISEAMHNSMANFVSLSRESLTGKWHASAMTGRDIPNDYRRDAEAYTTTVQLIRLLYGSQPPDDLHRIEFFQQFGWLGYDVHVFDRHIEYIEWLNTALFNIGHVFDPIVIRKWRLVNNLIVSSYNSDGWLRSEGLPLAAMAGFPLLEEVARRTSGFWTEDGKLLNDPPEEISFRSLGDDSAWRPRTGYKESKRIVELAHKLELMQWSLPKAFRDSFSKLNEIVDHPAITGVDEPGSRPSRSSTGAPGLGSLNRRMRKGTGLTRSPLSTNCHPEFELRKQSEDVECA